MEVIPASFVSSEWARTPRLDAWRPPQARAQCPLRLGLVNRLSFQRLLSSPILRRLDSFAFRNLLFRSYHESIDTSCSLKLSSPHDLPPTTPQTQALCHTAYLTIEARSIRTRFEGRLNIGVRKL